MKCYQWSTKFAVAVWASAFLPMTVLAAEWFVSPGGTDAVGGGTEAAPFRTINYAIGQASANDTITLLPGDYVEGSANNSRVNVSKTLVIRSKNGRATRDTTRIVGAYDDNATSPVGMGANALRCVRISGSAAGTRIEGITFYRGSTDYNGNSGATEATMGGGVLVCSSVAATIVDCAFIECQATRGGGLYTDGNASANMSAHRCLFKRCRDTKFGAGMRGGAAFNCVFDDCAVARDSSGGEIGEPTNAKDAFAYGYQAVNCTFVNGRGYGVAASSTLFKGGVYNCLSQNNFDGTVKNASSATAANNIDGGNLYDKPEVYSPYDNDYRLTANANAINAGDISYLNTIQEEFRSTDYYGNPRTTADQVHAGAVQKSLSVAVSGIAVAWSSAGNWLFGGEKVEMGYRTWKACDLWPAPLRVKFVFNNGNVLIRYGLGGSIVWPLRDDSAWLTTTRAGQVQTVTTISTQNIYWTDPVNGNDDTGDGTEANPYLTLQKAITATTNRHVVYAKAGDYAEGSRSVSGFTSRVGVPDTLTTDLRVLAVDGPEVTFITGQYGTGDATYKLGTDAIRCVGVASTNNNVAIQGFTLRNGRTSSDANGSQTMGGAFANISSGGSSLANGYLLDCRIEDCAGRRGGAMYGGTAMRCIFSGCRTSNGAGGGVFRSCSVISSLVTGSGGVSELFAGSATAYNVTTYGNNVASLYNGDNGAGNLRNSIITGRTNNESDLYGSNITDNGVQYCLYSKAVSVPSGVTMPTSVQEDPVRFLDVALANYRLSEDSAGCALASATFLKSCMDLNGDPFHFDGNGRYEAGCYAARAGATIYVDAANGSDVTGDGSEETPFATLAAAMATAEYGDTVTALPGTYASGTMVPSLAQAGGSVTPSVAARVVVKSGVTLVSRDGAAVTTIRGASATGGGCGNDAVRCAFVCKGATLRGFTLTGGYTAATAVADGSQDMTVDNVGGGVCGYYAGTSVSSSEFAELIEDCIITGNQALRGGGAMYGTYRNCTFLNNTLCEDKPGWALARAKAEGCYFAGNGSSAYGTYGHSAIYNCSLVNCTVRGGQAYNSGAVCNEGGYATKRAVLNTVIVSARIKVAVATNCVFGSSTANVADAPATNAIIIGRANLDDNGVPTAGSTAIDAGDASFCSAEFLAGHDILGTRRILNGTIDIGAYEYDWGVPWAKSICEKRLVIDDMPSNATLVGERLTFTDGTVSMAWEKGRSTAPYSFNVCVTGNGTLTVTVNGAVVGAYTVADGAKELRFTSELESNVLQFAYTSGDGDTGGAELYGFSHANGLIISFR